MGKSKGLLIWGEDGDPLADFVGQRLAVKPPEYVAVVKYEGPKVSREPYLKMQDYATFKKVLQENEPSHFPPDVMKRIKHNVESRFGYLESEIDKFVRMRNEWIIGQFKEYQQRGAKFEVNLHSTECERPHSDGSEDAIHLEISYHHQDRKAKRLMRGYESRFHKRFKNDFFSSVDNISSIPSVMMIELKNNPYFVSGSRAENIVRDFLAHTLEKY